MLVSSSLLAEKRMRFLMVFTLIPLLLLASPDHVLHVHAGQYNFFYLALRWPPTFCRYKHRDVACKTPYKSYFTIHGMWPMKTFTEATPGNPNTFPFDQNVMTGTLVRNLQTSWPELRQGYNDMSFWRSEWDKHGSGSATRDKDDWQRNYFTYANQHFTTLSLGDLGFTQGKSYSFQAIKDAISNKVQNKYIPAVIECYQDPKSKVWTLYQIKFCISKDGKSITDETKLPGCGKYRGNCPWREDILFPENLPTAVM